MLRYLEEFRKFVIISGLKNVHINDTDTFIKKISDRRTFDAEAQLFDARLVATWQHLYFAALNALNAFRNRENISKSLAMETMLYASAQHQIKEAVKLLGIKPQTSEIGLLIIGDNKKSAELALSLIQANSKAQLDDSVLGLTEEKIRLIRKVYGISDTEVNAVLKKDGVEEALTDLVIERMALIATKH